MGNRRECSGKGRSSDPGCFKASRFGEDVSACRARPNEVTVNLSSVVREC